MTKIKIIDDPTPFVIDVLRMELEQKLPYWLSKGLKEDAEPVNHTGAGIATFDPLLKRRKRRERFFKRKPVRGRCGGASREWRSRRDGYEFGCS